jgi:hypothetical protein
MCFADQLHQNVEAYVDDMVIKTRNPDDLIADLEEKFSRLHRFRSTIREIARVHRQQPGN